MTTADSRYRLKYIRQVLAPLTVHWFSRLGSTNTRAAEMAREGAILAPSVVLTGWQVAGRGRGTNTWWASAGSLTMTLVLPSQPERPAHQLPLLVGSTARRTVHAMTGIDVKLKWPNDLLHDGRKLGGILCERVNGLDLVGLGLNINLEVASAPPLLQKRITSLSQISGGPLDQTEVLIRLVSEITAALSQPNNFSATLDEYAQHHALTGRTVSVSDLGHPTITGTCVGLDEEGRLMLRVGHHTQHVISGHVEVYGTP